MKNVLLRVFSLTQQQLCLFHINANVNTKIKSRWKDSADEPDEPIRDEESDQLYVQRYLDDEKELATAQDNSVGIGLTTLAPPTTIAFEQSREGMYEAWKKVTYAPTESDFQEKWKKFISTYGSTQTMIVKYIISEYLPWREQWAKCFIDRYRNFGQRVNSPVETAHKDVKSYLLTGKSDILGLHTALVQMLEKKERDYHQNAAAAAIRVKRKYMTREWLGVLPLQIAPVAVKQLVLQYRVAEATVQEAQKNVRLQGGPLELPVCPDDCYFTQKYALPCAHFIAQRLVPALVPLTKDLVHPRWWLQKPIVGLDFFC